MLGTSTSRDSPSLTTKGGYGEVEEHCYKSIKLDSQLSYDKAKEHILKSIELNPTSAKDSLIFPL